MKIHDPPFRYVQGMIGILLMGGSFIIFPYFDEYIVDNLPTTWLERTGFDPGPWYVLLGVYVAVLLLGYGLMSYQSYIYAGKRWRRTIRYMLDLRLTYRQWRMVFSMYWQYRRETKHRRKEARERWPDHMKRKRTRAIRALVVAFPLFMAGAALWGMGVWHPLGEIISTAALLMMWWYGSLSYGDGWGGEDLDDPPGDGGGVRVPDPHKERHTQLR